MAVAVIDKTPIIEGLVGQKVRVRWEELAVGQVVGELGVDALGRIYVFDEDNDPVNAQPGIRFQFENIKAVINDRFIPIIELTEKVQF